MIIVIILAVIGAWTICSLLNMVLYDILMPSRSSRPSFDAGRRQFILLGPASLLYATSLTVGLLAVILLIVVYDKIRTWPKRDLD